MSQIRRLAAILAADIAGYSRLMGEDEAGTAQALREHSVAAEPLVAKHGGRIVKTTGDGVLIEFSSVVGAVECALALQQLAMERNASVRGDRRMEWRIGIHLGDVLVEGEDILGDGVNIAARLEGIAEPGGICISEDAFRQVRGKVDAEVADIGEQSLKNIARPIRVYGVRTALTHPDADALWSPLSRTAGESADRRRREAGEGSLPLPDKPSIAVLPFVNLSGDPEQEYFADGMVEEIITALSRIRWLFVIARNSSFTYKGQSIDVKQVGRELGVRYVLEGSVRKAGGRVRITAQLIDAQSGAHLWADRFDGALEDVFDLQDKVAVRVAGIIEPTLQAAETARSTARRTEDLSAYDLYLRAYAMQLSEAPEALGLLDEAIARDPNYGPVLALAALFHATRWIAGWSEDPEADCSKGADFAQRALRVAGDDAGTIVDAANALAVFGEDIGAMMALVDRALALNPSFARGWNYSGLLSLFAGQPERAIEHAETALRLSPRARVGTTLGIIGTAYLVSRRFDEALPKLLLAIQEAPAFPVPYRWLASCYAHMGRLDEARDVVGRLRAISPVVVPPATQFRNPT
jgi:TolB-like protein/class 3 adenylate cyclase